MEATVLMSTLSLIPPWVDQPMVAATAVTDLLWPHTTPADGVQHMYARPGAGGIDVAIFTLAVDQSVADITAYVVCLRALDRIPALRSWQVLRRSR
ncbi:hypothetical protein [Actinoplanes sp. NPDC026623]|uniref:hypothetical protein n=1 Tax=Actinoplanes sp. NPDC026623 TaxID=3155610 RepID=UPI0033C2E1B4